MSKIRFAVVAIALLLVVHVVRAGEPFPGRRDVWHGHARYSFELDGRTCHVVVPETPAPGRPWIWRARFWGHRPELDLALLDRGFHLVYSDVANLYGSPEAVKRWDAFYKLMVEQHGLARKVVLEGMSRGGLIIYNWAAQNPGKVACIYADAPVCDIKSWPGGFGAGPGSPRDWERCKQAYGFANDDEARAWRANPLENLEPLAKAGVPLFHVTGDADDIVPMAENTAVLAERYKSLGGEITVVVKPGVGHKHGLDDVTPLVAFVLQHAGQAGEE